MKDKNGNIITEKSLVRIHQRAEEVFIDMHFSSQEMANKIAKAQTMTSKENEKHSYIHLGNNIFRSYLNGKPNKLKIEELFFDKIITKEIAQFDEPELNIKKGDEILAFQSNLLLIPLVFFESSQLEIIQ